MPIKKRIILTADEIEAILGVAGAADAPAVCEDCYTVAEGEVMLAAFERGMEKLRRILEGKRRGT